MKASEPYHLSKVQFARVPTYSLVQSTVQQSKSTVDRVKHIQYVSFKKNTEKGSPLNRLSPKSFFNKNLTNSHSHKINKEQKRINMRRNSSAVENERPQLSYAFQKSITTKNITAKNSPTSAKYETMKNIDNFNLKQRRKNFFQSMNERKNIRLNKNKISGQNFDIIKLLGKGKYGKVFLVRDKICGFLTALKVVDKKQIIENDLLDQFTREVKIQMFLDHPGIIKLYGYFEDQKNFYLLMQLGCDGELYHYTTNGNTFSESSASHLAKNLLQTFSYIHRNQIIHRDIKPQNIVVNMGTVKLCDFGWAVHNSFQMRSTFCGTPLYFSPELLQGRAYNEKIDLWAIGVIIYELVFGKSPFNLQKPGDLPKIVTDEIDFPQNSKISPEFRQFLQRILHKNPNKRETAEILLSCKFIKKHKDNQICQQLCKKIKK